MHSHLYMQTIEPTASSSDAKMDNRACQPLSLLDLPNELLLLIMKQLPMVDALYSLVGVTQRLDQLVLNPVDTRTLDLTCLKVDALPERIYSTDDHVLETICREVLPRVHHHVAHLIVDQSAVERVFDAADYPELDSLSLRDMDETFFTGCFSDPPTHFLPSSYAQKRMPMTPE
jgi:hypothetical protein